MIRRFGLSNTGRLIMADVERKGAAMKQGEMIMVSTGMSSLDDRKYADPFKVDFNRPETIVNDKPAHDTFGNGPHRCVGAPLARAELSVFLEEWLKVIPDFRIAGGEESLTERGGGAMMTLTSLPLAWDVTS